MPSYLERYLDGHREAVWQELVSLGPGVLAESIVIDATSVAQEIVGRVIQNLRTLEGALREVGYEFQNPDQTLVEAGADHVEELRRVEEQHGRFPLILQAWYGRIASVDFSQSEAQAGGDHRLAGLGMNTPLFFLSIRDALKFRERLLEEDSELGPVEDFEEGEGEGKYYFPLGGFASNCEPKAVFLPAPGADAVIYNDGGGDVFFVDQLRHAFKWLGFPSWKRLIEHPRARPRKGEPDFQNLLSHLQVDFVAL